MPRTRKHPVEELHEEMLLGLEACQEHEAAIEAYLQTLNVARRALEDIRDGRLPALGTLQALTEELEERGRARLAAMAAAIRFNAKFVDTLRCIKSAQAGKESSRPRARRRAPRKTVH